MDDFEKRLKRVQGEPIAGDDAVFNEDDLLENGDFLFEKVGDIQQYVSRRWIAKNCLGMTDKEYDEAVQLANAMYEEQKKDDGLGSTRE